MPLPKAPRDSAGSHTDTTFPHVIMPRPCPQCSKETYNVPKPSEASAIRNSSAETTVSWLWRGSPAVTLRVKNEFPAKNPTRNTAAYLSLNTLHRKSFQPKGFFSWQRGTPTDISLPNRTPMQHVCLLICGFSI